MYLPSFGSHPDCEVVAICGRNRDKAKALANKFNIDAVYTEYDQFLAHDGLDAVAIATPNDLHHAMAIDDLRWRCSRRLASKILALPTGYINYSR